MRRLVLLGLLGLGGGCVVDPPPPPPVGEEKVCPNIEVNALPPSAESLQASATSPRSASAPGADDGREPVLVLFRQRTGLRTAARLQEDKITRVGGKVTYHLPRLGLVAARLSAEERARLAQDPEVLSIRPDRPVHALGLAPLPVSALLAAPNPSGDVREYTEGVKMVQAPQVWDANNDGVLDTGAPTGEGIKVCIIDSGIDDRHPELQVPYAGGKDFVDDDDNPKDQGLDGTWGGGHGTHVAGTIAAQLGAGGTVNPNDASLSPGGVVGVAPGASLLIARVLDKGGNGSTSDVIAALDWCQTQGAHIVSMSLGAPEPDEAEQAAIKSAWAAGMLLVAASGNAGTADPVNNPPPAVYPAAYDEVIAVGAVDFKAEHPQFSQTGSHLSLVAPGVNVFSSYIVGAAPYTEVEADGALRISNGVEYAGMGEYSGVLVDCGRGIGVHSCGQGANCEGFVAYVDRGDITFAEKVRNVRAQGALAVVIANNDPDDGEGNFTLSSPGAWPPVASVSSNTGATLKSLVGTTIRVGVKGGDYAAQTGTSMATPHVSGVAALVWSARPSLTKEQVRSLLERSAKDLGPVVGKDILFGHGLVQAKAALELLAQE